MTTVRRIEPHEWPSYRAVRLRALRDSPDAFGSTLEAERALPDTFWSRRLAGATLDNDAPLWAMNGEEVCGLVWGKRDAHDAALAHLFQMWVAPAARGRGTGRALLRAALDWAVGAGVRRVRLGVTVGDSPASRLYASHGFVAVGEPEPLRQGSPLMARTLECALGAAPAQRASGP